MLNLIRNTVSNFRNSAATQSANNFLAAAGITGPTQSKAITQLVADLYSSGLWTKMKAVYPMVTDNYNLLSYTEDFSNASWTKTSVTVTANTTTAPNGTLTADTFNDGVANSLHQVYAQINSLPIGTYIFSFYYKSNTSTKNIAIYPFATSTTGGTGTGGVILTQNGTFVANVGSGVVSYGSQDVGNGWRRFYVVGTSTAISNAYPVIAFADGSNITYTGSNTDAYIWGAQLELGNTATTYQQIATTPSAFMASQMKYNLKDARDLDAAFRLTWSGGWTYSATGATPNGTNAYADTKVNGLNNLTPTSTHFSYYSRTNVQNDAFLGLAAQNGGSNPSNNPGIQLLLRGVYYNNQIHAAIGESAGTTTLQNIIATNTNSASFFNIVRSSSTLETLYKGNTILGTNTTSFSANFANANLYLGARNLSNVASNFDTRQIAFATIGNGLTDTDSFLLNQIVEKYQVALSRGVQAAQSFYYNSAYSNEANTYLYSTQITGTTQVSAINTLINGLKANNLWTKMKAVYPFVTDYRNLLSYTEDFTNAYWNKYGSTITANTVIAPNGTLTADTLQENTLNTEHHVKTTLNGLIPSETYTYSNYVKYNDRRYMLITVYYNGGIYPNYYATFDILNGVFVSQSGGSGATIIGSSITADNNGWYRITVSGQLGVFSNNIVVQTNLLDDSLAQVYIGTSKSAYVWGAQFETGSTATPYQPVLAANSSSTFMSSQMKFNLVNPQDSDAAFRLAFSGGWTYSTNGAQPNGTNGYADTKFNLSSNFSTREQSYSLYTQASNSNANVLAGVTDGSSPTQFYNGTGQFNILSTFYSKGSSFSNGCILMTSTLSAISAFEKAIKIGTTSGSTYSAVNYNYYIGARNNAGTSDFFADRRYSFAHIGNTLTDAEAILFSQLIQQFQTDLSRQV